MCAQSGLLKQKKIEHSLIGVTLFFSELMFDQKRFLAANDSQFGSRSRLSPTHAQDKDNIVRVSVKVKDSKIYVFPVLFQGIADEFCPIYVDNCVLFESLSPCRCSAQTSS